jgi:hypothetical protein
MLNTSRFCETYELGLSTFPKELKPHNLEQVADWIEIIEGENFDSTRGITSHNANNTYLVEGIQKTMHIISRSVLENRHLSCCRDEDSDYDQSIGNLQE